MERFVQMKLFAKSLHHLRCELGIKGIYLAGFSGSEVNDQKRDNRDKEEGDDLLYDATAYE